MHLYTTTCPALIVEHHRLIYILAPLRLELAARPLLQQRIESKRTYNLRSKKLFGLVRGDVTDPAILQEIETTAIGSGRAAWAILQGHRQPPHTGLTNIDDDSEWSALRLSDVGIDERTITKI
eukprot:2291050-Pleurochrysis_carterae.AAC.1